MKTEILSHLENGVPTITLSGDLTIRSAQRIKEALSAINGKEISIKIVDVTSIDITFLQLLLIKRNEFHHGLSISARLSDADRKLLHNCGFTFILDTDI